MNIVWFKKDLRVFDHQPLTMAMSRGPTVGLFVFEPEWFESVEFDARHLKFAVECLENLTLHLRKLGVPLVIKFGSMTDVLSRMNSESKIKELYSHQETGLFWTYERDLKVKIWTQDHSIEWKEFKQFAVVRKLKDRDTWNVRRPPIIGRPIVETRQQNYFQAPWASSDLPYEQIKSTQANLLLQKGGRSEGVKLIDSFLSSRSQNYMKSLSSPNLAFDGCSRISPHLTWGTLSLTEVHHALLKKKASLQSPNGSNFFWSKSLEHFENRLWWHCHFIQKLETEPEIEFENFNREFDGMRESEFNESHFEAWCKGETGFPLIDACMRALHQHGWINFRMRAMLMSFATYQLWLHWKRPAEFLARLFVDFEPGIHYSQAQMQSGVTGINSIRIYSPKKQVQEQDPNGSFIKRFIPELENVSASDIAEPHLIPPLLLSDSNFKPGRDYPFPIVDPTTSYEVAKKKIFAWKNRDKVKIASGAVLERHGSRSNSKFPRQKRGPF